MANVSAQPAVASSSQQQQQQQHQQQQHQQQQQRRRRQQKRQQLGALNPMTLDMNASNPSHGSRARGLHKNHIPSHMFGDN